MTSPLDDAKLVERLRVNATFPVCPFDRRSPDYGKDFTGKPCPVCGETEEPGSNKCTGADTRIMIHAADRLSSVLEAAGYAERLAVALWEKHYKQINPHWKPLSGDLIGILTQIDNMTVGLSRAALDPIKPDEKG